MLTAENDCLPGGKVGGIGDVLRDVPPALAELGHRVSIIMPAYGALHLQEQTRKLTLVNTSFEGQREALEVFQPWRHRQNLLRRSSRLTLRIRCSKVRVVLPRQHCPALQRPDRSTGCHSHP